MKLLRRQFLHLAAGAAALPAGSNFAWAETYPTRPVHLIVSFPAGGGADVLARLIGQRLSERLGQPFVIENKPGAGTNIGTEAVVRASPDGYTQVTQTNAINATLYDKLNYDFMRDITPVAGVVRYPNVLEVHPSFPATTVPEFIAYAKANPGRINMAVGLTGSSPHVSGELFKIESGLNVVLVPYRSSAPMLTDLLGGQVHGAFDALPGSIESIRAGKLRPDRNPIKRVARHPDRICTWV